MKRLSINDIAAASLRTGKKAYLSLAIGIFLSIFLVTSLFLSVRGAMLAKREQVAREFGHQDFVLMDSEYTDSEMMATGMYGQIGHIYVTGRIAGSGHYLGYYDEDGAQLQDRTLIEGRMPEKAGELAIEEGVLEYLRLDAGVGDTITMNITALQGADEERTFTITGLLRPMSDVYYDAYFDQVKGEYAGRFPVAVLHESEPPFATGRTAMHQLFKVADGIDFSDALKSWENRRNFDLAIDPAGTLVYYAIQYDSDMARSIYGILSNMYSLIAIGVGLALAIACCVGIAQALDSQLSRKVDQIGMLRAVGATRRQIRKIFGREAWMLALILSPLSVAAGCGFAYLLSLIAPSAVMFAFEWEWVLPILIASAVMILLAAGLPLRRACRISPMGVIRDTQMLRKVKGVRSQKQFSAPKLISKRQIRLHRGHQAGAIIMVMLLMVCVGVAAAFGLTDMSAAFEDYADYEVYLEFPPEETFVDVQARSFLTASDINQLRALPMVEKVGTKREVWVNLVWDGEVPSYLKAPNITNNWHLDDNIAQYAGDEFEVERYKENYARAVKEHEAVREGLSIDGSLVGIRLYVFDQWLMEGLTTNVAEGDIDFEAINEGRELLVYAPDCYRLETTAEGYPYVQYECDPSEWMLNRGAELWRANDAFTAGQALDLTCISRTQNEENIYRGDYTAQQYAQMDRTDAQVSVGAVLKGSIETRPLGGSIVHSVALFTTVEGARAMGLTINEVEKVEVYLTGQPDLETEEYLTGRIEAISARGNAWSINKNVESVRMNREIQAQLLLGLMAVVVVFFSVSFSLIAGNVKRRIRADERMIGTLRAVGANKAALIGCYSGQVARTIVIGGILAALIGLWIGIQALGFTGVGKMAFAAAMAATAAGCYFACLTAMNQAIRGVISKSVVENIREL